jgi:hypothetical protein
MTWHKLDTAPDRVKSLAAGIYWPKNLPRIQVMMDTLAPGVPLYLFWRGADGAVSYARVIPPGPSDYPAVEICGASEASPPICGASEDPLVEDGA